ncbi:jg2282 [Pararge aegeria aegeria]|uniref:Jg2282 protein n=1 Tax=Pararge aegeria aegeria TaxID=348720 RepID=A0A8S4RPL0_9NEOP|nr:jg2282 [Pararge aegeria aegeria]
MTRMMEWSNKEVIRLVKAYKAKRMLWDPLHDLYHVQTAKYEAWCELAEPYGCEIVELRKKFNSIFASYRREKAKIRTGGTSFWFLYKYLSFLPSHMDQEKSEKAKKKPLSEEPDEPPDEPPSDPEEYEDIGSSSPVHIIVKEETEITPQSPPRYFLTKPNTTLIHKRRREKEDFDKQNTIESKLLKRTKLYKKKDECDSFGEYIAIALRKHDDKTKSMIKQAINNILFEQEMKKYNSGQYAVIYTGVEENPLIVPNDCENKC